MNHPESVFKHPDTEHPHNLVGHVSDGFIGRDISCVHSKRPADPGVSILQHMIIHVLGNKSAQSPLSGFLPYGGRNPYIRKEDGGETDQRTAFLLSHLI